MKVSELAVKPEVIHNHLRLIPEYVTDDDAALIEAMRVAAIEYVKSTCGITDVQIDEHEDITIAVLVLISDMWDDRSRVGKNNVVSTRNYSNRTVETILGLYDENLI